MSIRYDRQYKQNVDIDGPVGPTTNEDQTNLNFLNNNDVYLGGGGGAGGGGSAPVETPVYIDPPYTTNPPIDIIQPTPENPTPNDPLVPLFNYEIAISSNLQEEAGDFIKLKYDILSNGAIQEQGDVLLSDYNTDGLSSAREVLKSGILNLYLENNLPSNYSISKIYYTNKLIATKNPTDYTKWNVGNNFIGIQASELLTGGVAVAVILEKTINSPKPIISLDFTNYSKQIKDSDTEGIINVKFGQTNCDFVDFYIASDKKIRVEAGKGSIELLFKKDFGGIFGSKKIIVVPYSNLYGTGDKSEIILNFISVNDFPSITEIVYPTSIDIPSFSDYNIQYDVKYTSFAASSVDVYLQLKDKTFQKINGRIIPNGSFSINLASLKQLYPNWSIESGVVLKLKPTNNSGENPLEGNDYEIKTELLLPNIVLDESIIKKSIYDAFIEKLQFLEPEKESKYLTHLANFGNDEQIIISSWESDNWTLSKKSIDELGNEIVKPEDEVKSVILKLYNPLPANVSSNSTFWITKLMSNPLIETIILNEQDDIKCPFIKGPNFDIEVDFVKGQSTGFESLDTLILSGSVSSSTQLISSYLSSSLVNTDELNIEYYISGSTDYAWNNFVHFSSAKERVDNFIYKVQLIEKYEELISQSLYYSGSVAQISAGSGSVTGSISSLQERERQLIKKNQLLQGFDGFEKFLYTSSSYTTNNSDSITWPYSGSTKLLSSDTISVEPWYNNIKLLAEDYDIENTNYVLNNIPQYIRNNTENDSLILFFTMIGQHFDNIYFYTKSIEKTRSLGYKAKDGISDKLLFDVLKSFNWDAKNLSADSKLWDYAFGLNSNGGIKNETPAKQRTYEVWRRIVNNLPYLLKHKGTRRGVYALMSCYGIPSSNLSIFEFGGPEVNSTSKSKLVFDNMTTALKMDLTSSIQIDWSATNNTSSLRPNTIEFFVKPYDNLNYTLISGSGWNVSLTASLSDNNLGYVAFNYNSTNSLTSSLLPIFNGQFFGVSVSSGSNGLKLDVRQSNKERTIFQESITASVASNWNTGNSIKFGGNYSGSVDEFRMWSSQLDTQRFYEHVSFPEMINGNDILGSTDELHFRLDFEYPKNLDVYRTLPNVDTNIYYPSIQLNPSSSLQLTRNILEETGSINFDAIKSENPMALYSASAFGFSSKPDYPFNFEPIDRSVVLEIPDMGSTRYSTNKVRFESQTTFNGNDVSGGVDLSVKTRATKKAFDQSPTDSNRVGLFFSPTKELNIDIAKSFGGINLDNYIGDPGDRTKSNYASLDNLRNYYFQRFDGRDIYAYINLIKLYEKSMFEDIKKMLPARVKATTGLLIEPHILERSKIAQKDPTGEDYQKDVTIHYNDTTILTADNNQYETIVNADLSENISGENNQYYAEIYTASLDTIIAENYQYDAQIYTASLENINAESYQREVSIDAGLDLPSITTEIDLGIETYGQTAYETIGFGIYAENGYAIRTYFDKDSRRIKERIKVDLVKEQKQRIVTKFAVTASINGLGDPRGGYVSDIQTYYETKLNIQPYSGSKVINAGTGSIVEVTPVDGYLPTHYRNTSDLTRGLQNSYFRGSKNTVATTLDGTSPIETFVSNPNTLVVNKTGRSTNEPILEVE
jgi:hypothetical protein